MITYYQTGKEMFAEGDYEGAIASYSNEIELNPQDGKVFERRALAKDMLNRHDEAIEDYTLAIALSKPDEGSHYFGYYNRALARMGKKNFFAAIEDMDRVIDLDPCYYLAYYHRAGMRCKIDDYSNAVIDLTKAIELKPDDAYSYYFRGMAKHADGIDALSDFLKAKELGCEEAQEMISRLTNGDERTE